MEDITPDLLKKIQADFQSGFDKSTVISELYEKVRDGTATYLEANKFAIETGDILAEAYKNNLSSAVLPDGKMYYNIAQRIIDPTMSNNYSLITDVTNQVQKSLNEAANIGIKAITPELNQDRIDKIIDRVSDAEQYDDIAWILYEPVKNFSQSIVDDSIRINADFHHKAGMTPKIVRKMAGGCCEWCNKLAGTYRYPDVPKDVYRRHQRCRCMVEYNPGDGKVQDVHTKHWMSEEESNKREARKLATKQNIKRETPEERENRIAEKYGLADEEKRREERIQSTKKVTEKDLDSMSLGDLRKLAKEKAAEYYKSGLSGISFGSHDMDKAAELLTQNASRTSLKKDIISIQKKMSKSVETIRKSDIIRVDKTTITAEPNCITEVINKKGGIDRNYYGADGKQIKQISNNDHGKPKKHPFGEHGEHAHDYVYDENGKVIERTIRELNPQERKENEDILWD